MASDFLDFVSSLVGDISQEGYWYRLHEQEFLMPKGLDQCRVAFEKDFEKQKIGLERSRSLQVCEIYTTGYFGQGAVRNN